MPRLNVKDKRKKQLVDATMASIAKRGYAETTVTHVSQGAGMSRGIINFYFSSKEIMMQETLHYLLEEYTALWQSALEKAGNVSALEKLGSIVDAHFHKDVCNSKWLAVWAAFVGHATTHADYRKLISAQDELLISRCQELLAAHVKNAPATAPVQQLAVELHGMLRGFWLSILLSGGTYDRKQLAGYAKEWLTGLAAPAKMAAGNAVSEPREKTIKVSKEREKAGKGLAKKKPQKGPATILQLDFGDLFDSKK